MGTKRPHSDIHPSRRPQVPQTVAAKKRKTNPHPHRVLEKKSFPLNPIKSRIRSLNRLLQHKENLPADVRLNHERELASCNWELQQAREHEQRKSIIGRYHMVRFFDRRKCERRVKQCRRAVEAEGGDAKEVLERKKRLHEAEVDLNYALFYPLDRAYSALYPSKGKGKEGEAEAEAEMKRQGDGDMWALVEKCMEEGKLDALRSGKLLKGSAGPVNDDDIAMVERKDRKDKKAKKSAKKGGKDAKEEVEQPAEEDEDSDGGFFE